MTGSRPSQDLLNILKPKYWFSAHLHVKFSALVRHPHEEGKETNETRFLALDKCLPRRNFLQILEIGPKNIKGSVKLCYDKEWLAVLKSTNHLISTSTTDCYMPGKGYVEGRWSFTPTQQELDDISQTFKDDFLIPSNFEITALPYDPQKESLRDLRSTPHPRPEVNNQTKAFCEKMNIDDPLQLVLGAKKKASTKSDADVITISNYIGELKSDQDFDNITLNEVQSTEVSLNKDEIILDDEEEDEDNCAMQNLEHSNVDISSELNDSAPKKAKLQLPEPKCDTSTMMDDLQLPSPITHVVEKAPSGEESTFVIDTQGNNIKDLKEVVPKKTFKRRNVAIYEENESD